MRRQRAVDVLTNDPLASALDITDEQKEKLKETAQQIDEERARDIEELRTRARQKLFAELRSDQKRKLSEILGEDFDYQTIDWRGKTRKGVSPAKEQ